MSKFLATFFLLFSIQASFGNQTPTMSETDCSDTDIRDTNPNIKKSPLLKNHFSTPRNQDSVGWCYAFTAADLATAEIGVPISAMHTSAMYNRSIYVSDEDRISKDMERVFAKGRYKEIYEGGWAQDAINVISKQGWVCSEKGLPFDAQKPELIDDLIKGLEALKLKASNDALSAELVCKEVSNLLTPYEIMSSEVEDIANSLVTQNLNITMERFSRIACKEAVKTIPHLKIEKVEKPKIESFFGKQKYFQQLNTNLDKGKPIAVDYQLDTITGQKGVHAGLITGRRWKNGVCQYKIRNTWGESCGSYKKSIECVKSEGSFWVSHEIMYDASLNLHYISN